jgi:NitT/TauT family transport system substrate-binding protein
MTTAPVTRRAMLTSGAALTVSLAPGARAEELVVSNYAAGSNGFPFAIALDRGMFKAEGLDITGIMSSEGGGTTVRNMVAGGVVYGEMNPAAFVAATQQGAKLRLVSDNSPVVVGFV